MKRFLVPSLCLVVLISILSSCGRVPVCFLGLGDCSKMYDPNKINQNGVNGLPISGPKTISYAAGRVSYQASGGTGMYTYSVIGTADPCGQFINSTNVQIGTFVPLKSNTTCNIQAQDTGS